MNKKNRAEPGFLMPIRKIKRHKNNNIVKMEQIRLKNGLNRLIYLKNTTNFVIYAESKKTFCIRL